MPARWRQRLRALAAVPVHGDVVEKDATGGQAGQTFSFEARPAFIGGGHLALSFGDIGAERWSSLARRRLEMLLIPELSAQRVFLIHVDVIEALRRIISGVFDDRAIRPVQICEAAASC